MLAICGMGCVSYNLGNEYKIIAGKAGIGQFGIEAGFERGFTTFLSVERSGTRVIRKAHDVT